MKLDETRLKILRLVLRDLGGSHSGRSAAKLLKLTPARVSQVLNEYLKEGYLVKSHAPGEMGQWRPGPNMTEGVLSRLRVASDPLTGGTGGAPPFFEEAVPEDIPIAVEEGFTPVRVHNIGHRLPVFKAPENVPWTNQTWPSGVPNKILELPLDLDDNKRMAKIVYRESHDGVPSTLEIWTPEVIIVHPEAWLRFREWAASRAWNISLWLTKKFGIQYTEDGSMAIPEECGQFEVAVVIARDLAMAGKRLRLTDGIYYFDVYKNYGEIEVKGSTDQETDKAAWDLITAAKRVRHLEDRMDTLGETILNLGEVLVKGQEVIGTTLERLLVAQVDNTKTLTTLLEILTPEPRTELGITTRDLDPRDEERMYG